MRCAACRPSSCSDQRAPPSPLCRITPSCPTAQPFCALAKCTAVRSTLTGTAAWRQLVPSSSDSSTWPRWPTATSRVPARAIANSGLLAASRLGCAATCSGSAGGAASAAPDINSATMKRNITGLCSRARSEARAEAQRQQPAVFIQRTVADRDDRAVVLVLADEVAVIHGEGVLRLVVQLQPDAVVARALVAAAQSRGVALQADLEEQRDRQVAARDHLQDLR